MARKTRDDRAAEDARIDERLRKLVRFVESDTRNIGVLSVGEACAVALVLDRKDLLPESFPTILQAVDRIGPEWLRRALVVQKEGWSDDAKPAEVEAPIATKATRASNELRFGRKVSS